MDWTPFAYSALLNIAVSVTYFIAYSQGHKRGLNYSSRRSAERRAR